MLLPLLQPDLLQQLMEQMRPQPHLTRRVAVALSRLLQKKPLLPFQALPIRTQLSQKSLKSRRLNRPIRKTR